MQDVNSALRQISAMIQFITGFMIFFQPSNKLNASLNPHLNLSYWHRRIMSCVVELKHLDRYISEPMKPPVLIFLHFTASTDLKVEF